MGMMVPLLLIVWTTAGSSNSVWLHPVLNDVCSVTFRLDLYSDRISLIFLVPLVARCSDPNNFFIFLRSHVEQLQAREAFGERNQPGCVLQREQWLTACLSRWWRKTWKGGYCWQPKGRRTERLYQVESRVSAHVQCSIGEALHQLYLTAFTNWH